MKPITKEQAAKLREIRKAACGLGSSLRGLIGKIVVVRCTHEDQGIEHNPKICEYCRVFATTTSALDGIERMTDAIDAALTKGPSPAPWLSKR